MYLAKNKFGQIGRQQPFAGDEAIVHPSEMGREYGSVNVSHQKIAMDQARSLEIEKRRKAKDQQNRYRAEVARRLAETKEAAKRTDVLRMESQKRDVAQDLLKQYFGKQAVLGETDKVMRSLLPPKPADFSNSGGNLDYVAGDDVTGGQQFWADWRQERVVGNPLTRDGIFGPRVTDYDRAAYGEDVNQSNVVKIAGGTMLGRYHDHSMGALFDVNVPKIDVGSSAVQSTLSKLGINVNQKYLPSVSINLQQKPKTPAMPVVATKPQPLMKKPGLSTTAKLGIGAAIAGAGVIAFMMMRK